MQQFNTEHRKSQIHFNSKFCRQRYRPFQWYKIVRYITIEHILSLIMYTNYDRLQYEFSKTYRENNGDNHTEFYWFGRSLKFSVHKFGTMIKDGDITQFYHGIGEKLIFSKYIGDAVEDGIFILCPLSTSSVYEVAVNFTNDNNGLVIQFGHDGFNRLGQYNKYFSLSWLSDYGNEKECLFIQNLYVLKIYNIIDTKFGCEYASILSALKNINKIMDYQDEDDQIGYITNSIQALMKKIIVNQLSYTITEYDSFDSFRGYERKMCNIYFASKEHLKIDYYRCKQRYPFIIQILFNTDSGRINLNLLNTLYTNVREIHLKNIHLCTAVIENILDETTRRDTRIIIKAHKKSTISVQEAVDKYTMLFRRKKIFIIANLYENSLTIMNKFIWFSKMHFVWRIVHGMGAEYFDDVSVKITPLMNDLVKTQLSKQFSLPIYIFLLISIIFDCLFIIWILCSLLCIDSNEFLLLKVVGLYLNAQIYVDIDGVLLIPNCASMTQFWTIFINTFTIGFIYIIFLKQVEFSVAWIYKLFMVTVSIIGMLVFWESHHIISALLMAITEFSILYILRHCVDLVASGCLVPLKRHTTIVPFCLTIVYAGTALWQLTYLDASDKITLSVIGLYEKVFLIQTVVVLIVTMATGRNRLFRQWCIEHGNLHIQLKAVASNPCLGILKQFYYSKYQWIKLDKINSFLPNIEQLTVKHIRACSFIFDNILGHLKQGKGKLKEITIHLGDGAKNAYRHRVIKPKYNEVVQSCKELTGYRKHGDIFQNDWGSFETLYNIRDSAQNLENNASKIENIYHLDSLITSYAVLKYGKQFGVIGFNITRNGDRVYIQKV
eukprot:226482_1